MRDNKGFNTSFDSLIELYENSTKRRIRKLELGEISTERLNIVKQDMSKVYLYKTIAKYSAGYKIDELKEDLLQSIDLCYQSWDDEWKLKDKNGKVYEQYILSAYDEMLWMLSLAFLIKIPDSEFHKLVEVIDRDRIKDLLFEFIISSKIKSRLPISNESYKEHFHVPKVFEKLRNAIQENEKSISAKLIRDFIIKDWYKNHKSAGWHNSHKSPQNTYFGYWSFETAAIVKIIGINDEQINSSKYFPFDLL